MCCSCSSCCCWYWYCCHGSSLFVLVSVVIRMLLFSIPTQSSQLDFSKIFVYRSLCSFWSLLLLCRRLFPIPNSQSHQYHSHASHHIVICQFLIEVMIEESNRTEPNRIKSNQIKFDHIIPLFHACYMYYGWGVCSSID